MSIGRRRQPLFLPIREDGPDGFLGIGQRLLLGVAFVTTSGSAGTSTVKPPPSCGSRITE
jgi:hypothetical protein